MATRLYFHESTSGLSNLPTTNQGTVTTFGAQADAYTVNRTMNRTKGTSPSLKSIDNVSSLARRYYFTRFVSEPLTAQTISANTWTFNIGTYQSNVVLNFPVTGANQTQYACVYVWRPSTTSVVGFIINGNTNAQWNEYTNGATYNCQNVTFSGSSVTAQLNDVICQEMIFQIDPDSSSAYVMYIRYDGSTIVTTPGTENTDIASFLETPQNLNFITDFVDATSNYKDVLQQSPQQLITNSI